MSSGSSRPVYVPRRQRRQKQQEGRFHGAFTGGFSAGYYNTVGSAEGWTPNQSSNNNNNTSDDPLLTSDNNKDDESKAETTEPRQQRIEDFMDDQDHDEWGGPSALQSKFGGVERSSSTTTTAKNNHKQSSNNQDNHQQNALQILWNVQVPTSVGRDLLAQLGWHEGSQSALIPENNNNSSSSIDPHTNTNNTSGVVRLSRRRWRKIQLSNNNNAARIPIPKLDFGGLGWERHRDAPEFAAAHRNRHHQQSQNNQVYRVADVAGSGPSNEKTNNNATARDDASYRQAETLEDFVGTKSVGGFALHDDADDTYDDDNGGKGDAKHRNDAHYNAVAYDTEEASSEDDTNNLGSGAHSSTAKNSSSKASSSSRLFSSWTASGTMAALNGRNNQQRSERGSPMDRVLPGFVRGGALDNAAARQQLTDALEIPLDDIPRHVFGPNEHPSIFQVLSKAEQLLQGQAQQDQRVQESLKAATVAPRQQQQQRKQQSVASKDPHQPMAGPAFASLAQAMKDRFAPEGSNKSTVSTTTASKLTSSNEEKSATTVKRSLYIFHPAPLLCKRFHVPAISSRGTTASEPKSITAEQSFFETQVMQQMDRTQATSAKLMKRTELVPPTEKEEPLPRLKRPPMALYKSIFDPGNESSEEDDDNDETNGKEQTATPNDALVVYGAAAPPKADIAKHSSTALTTRVDDDDGRRLEKHHSKKRKHDRDDRKHSRRKDKKSKSKKRKRKSHRDDR